MFIYVTKEISSSAINIANNSSIIGSLSVNCILQLGLAAFRGHHYVHIESFHKKEIQNNIRKIVPPEYYSGLEKCSGTQSLSLLSSLDVLGVIAFKEETFKAIKLKFDQKNIIRINPKEVNSLELSEETHLLTENLNDGQFYNILAKRHLRFKHGIRTNDSICYLKRNGGGGTLGKVYEAEVKSKNHFCLAIVDSDKRHPDSKYGNTANTLTEFHNNNDHPFSEIYVMSKVTEIENLIPNGILKDHAGENHNLQYLTGKDLSYYDIKKGLTAGMLKYPRCNDYWKGIITECKIETPDFYKSKDSSFQVIRGWGDDILNNILSLNDNHKKLHNIKDGELSDSQKHEWDRISKTIVNWCIAIPPTRL